MASHPEYPNGDKSTAVNDSMDSHTGLQRHLGNRQIQLMAVGASIGTALFVGIGTGLKEGGPASLLLAFILYSCLLAPVNNCVAEMVVYMPVTGSFVRMAGKWVDPAWGFMAGWNFFLYEAILIPFEVSALNVVITSWDEHVPVWAPCVACMVLWGILNVAAVKHFGNAEFILSSCKVFLIAVLFSFTFVTMVGGNAQHDAFGFRYWSSPGAFATHISGGHLGRIYGFLSCLRTASLTIVGSEYVALIAAEVERPRTYLRRAFKTIYWRFAMMFAGCALCVGILIPSNDPVLVSTTRSPFVLAMDNLKVGVLPHLVNALLIAAIFSAGNGYVFCASRSLHCMALEGHAPKFFAKCTKQGIPWASFTVVMLFPLVSLIQMDKSEGGGRLLLALGDIVAAAQLINYFVMSVTYIFFHRALKVQGVDRSTLPYFGWCQPWCGYAGAVSMAFVSLVYGYTLFIPGHFNVSDFITCYTMPVLCALLFAGNKFKVVRDKTTRCGLIVEQRTRVVAAGEADLVWEKPAIDTYENALTTPPARLRDELMSLLWRTPRSRASTVHQIIGSEEESSAMSEIRVLGSRASDSGGSSIRAPPSTFRF